MSVSIKHNLHNSDSVILPLGIIPGKKFQDVRKGDFFFSFITMEPEIASCAYSYQLPVEDHRLAIKQTYGKPAEELVAPEGYEFTGPFRDPEKYEWILLDTGVAHQVFDPSYWVGDPCLILRKIEPKANVVSIADGIELSKQVAEHVDKHLGKGWVMGKPQGLKTDYTASEVRERYGRNVLEIVYGHKFNQFLIDYPGFSYTGKCEWVVPGGWYLSTSGPKKHDGGKYKNHLVGTHLTMTQIAHLPRIVTYTLTAVSDLFENEAGYLPTESGEMVTATGSPAMYVYTRNETV